MANDLMATEYVLGIGSLVDAGARLFLLTEDS